MSCKNCNTEISPSSPCFQKGCGCVHRVDTDCIDYSGESLSCTNIPPGATLSDIIQIYDDFMCDIISIIGALKIENIGEGEGFFAGINNLGIRQFKTLQSVHDSIIVSSVEEEVLIDVLEATTGQLGVIQIATQEEANSLSNTLKAITPATLPIASETQLGLSQIATQAEVNQGTNSVKYVTPATLSIYVEEYLEDTIGDLLPNATETQRGIIEIATQSEVDAGTDDERAITPLKYKTDLNIVIGDTINQLEQYIENYISNPSNLPFATTTQRGVAELATNTETQTGTDTERIVTPAALTSRTATDSRTGLIEIATQAESNALSDTTRAVTPGRQPIASTTQQGLIRIATNTEAQAGTNTTAAITPSTLQNKIDGLVFSTIQVTTAFTTAWSYDNTINVPGPGPAADSIIGIFVTATCTSSEYGYTVGDEVQITGGADLYGASTSQGLSMRTSNNSQIQVRIGSRLMILNQNEDHQTLTEGSWRLNFKILYLPS